MKKGGGGEGANPAPIKPTGFRRPSPSSQSASTFKLGFHQFQADDRLLRVEIFCKN